MKIKIRRGLFESNSSSTHSCNIMMEDDYQKWVSSNDLYFCEEVYEYQWRNSDIKPVVGCLYTKDEVIQFVKASKYFNEELWNDSDEEEHEEEIRELGFLDSEYQSDYLEGYSKKFTTPNGEKIIVFGEYGYNG